MKGQKLPRQSVDEAKARYLDNLRAGMSVDAAARAVGFYRGIVRAWRQNQDFAAVEKTVREETEGQREAESRRRKSLAKQGKEFSWPKKKIPGYVDPFIRALASGWTVSQACEAAGISYSSVMLWKRTDPEFAARWRIAVQQGIDRLEDEALRRAVNGVDRPVYQGGKKVGVVTDYSDALLMFLLKGKRPEVFNRPDTVVNNTLEVNLTKAQAAARLQEMGLPLPLIPAEFGSPEQQNTGSDDGLGRDDH